MTDRMTDVSQLSADPDKGPVTPAPLPAVRVVVTPVEGADLVAALASIRRQAYDGAIDVTVVGDVATGIDDGTSVSESLETAVSETDSTFDYLWILHADARPRPDALVSLVREVERHDAGLGASKLLKAGTRDVLEAIGSATDVFGEPYTGLDDQEVDLQQYDVVREVAYVTSVSMLVRRDLARGLGALDRLMPPDAAGLDFSQRARIAGARVIIVPSSEVYHQGRCHAAEGWRERAGRLRAMLIAYRGLTLTWLIPMSLLVGLLDSILNLFLLRWEHLASYIGTWAWNAFHLPSTIGARRRASSIRSVGDEELFRYQTSGSVRLRTVGAEITARVLLMFDEDQAITKGAKRVWSSPGIVGALLAVIVVLLSARGLIFGGIPNAGLNFAFEPPSVALGRFLGGWNETGLGSPVPVHPSVGFAGLASLAWFGAEGAARTLLTIGFGILAVAGMGRLLGRLGLRGPGRYMAGIVAIAGPGTSVLTGAGSWTALAAAAVLPWALRAVFVHPSEDRRGRLGAFGWAVTLGWLTAAISPALVIVPVLAWLVWRAQGGRRSRFVLALAALGGGVVAVNFLSGNPGWLLDPSRRIGLTPDFIWPGLLLLAALPLFLDESRHRRVAGLGALLGLGGIILALLGRLGPGFEEATLVTASVGAAIVVGVALDRFRLEAIPVVSTLAALVMLVISTGATFGGALGLPDGDRNDDLSFASTLADDGQPRRILYASSDKTLVPGEERPGPGIWYRLLDGTGTTIDEVWLPPERAGDRRLSSVVDRIATGAVLRPGASLAEFGIGWIVVDGPTTSLDSVLESQLDVVPLPFDTVARVYENPAADPIAVSDTGEIWVRDGLGWSGDIGPGRVELAVNYTSGWEPAGGQVDWYTTVAASTGRASYAGHAVNIMMGYVSLGVLIAGIVLIAVGRRRSS
ncbi:MAG: glycosyltransferase [Acidimicrobiia bacterium]